MVVAFSILSAKSILGATQLVNVTLCRCRSTINLISGEAE